MFNVVGGMGFNLLYTKSVFSAYLFGWKIGPLGIFSIQTKSVTTTTWIFLSKVRYFTCCRDTNAPK